MISSYQPFSFWMRVRERVEYKVAELSVTYKTLNDLAPPYLSSAFTHVADMPSRRRLRSASTDQLLVPSNRRSTIGLRALPIAGALSGTVFPPMLRLLRRWPSSGGG